MWKGCKAVVRLVKKSTIELHIMVFSPRLCNLDLSLYGQIATISKRIRSVCGLALSGSALHWQQITFSMDIILATTFCPQSTLIRFVTLNYAKSGDTSESVHAQFSNQSTAKEIIVHPNPQFCIETISVHSISLQIGSVCA